MSECSNKLENFVWTDTLVEAYAYERETFHRSMDDFKEQRIRQEELFLNSRIGISILNFAPRFANWAWGKNIPTDISDLEKFIIRGYKEMK